MASSSEQQWREASPAETSPNAPNLDEFPDGGLKAWSVVLGAWCCLFCSYGWVNTVGHFQTYYQEDLLSSYSVSAVSWITSVEASPALDGIGFPTLTIWTGIMYASSPIYGKIYDNYGPKPLLVWGTGAHVFGLMVASLGKEYYQIFLAQSVCSALGAAAPLFAGTGPIGSWFLRRRALAFGVMASGSSLSGIIVARLLPRIGFPWTIRICAFLFLGLLCIALVVVEPRVWPKPKPWELKAFFRPLREPAFLTTTLSLANYQIAILNATRYSLSPHFSSALLTIKSNFGRIIRGWLGDRIRCFNIAILTTAISSIFALALWIPATTPALTIAFAALFGFTSGTLLPTVHNGDPIAGALTERDDGGFMYAKLFSGVAVGVRWKYI
ncbi:major facilitator superfamily domain-containing protein [Aspergillus recurvatus]